MTNEDIANDLPPRASFLGSSDCESTNMPSETTTSRQDTCCGTGAEQQNGVPGPSSFRSLEQKNCAMSLANPIYT
ncbi:hypothetical protein AC578_6127 [Pseudocercospora eumusae]|uniref:Uncharacterized protein n=1 Tax=Pseudocercospora eumusae TaxID=321146 RepID=A0A139GXP0_9PEZI|nr:hypothetical protein AC578_6127 [Pseudocercospora eumusae]